MALEKKNTCKSCHHHIGPTSRPSRRITLPSSLSPPISSSSNECKDTEDSIEEMLCKLRTHICTLSEQKTRIRARLEREYPRFTTVTAPLDYATNSDGTPSTMPVRSHSSVATTSSSSDGKKSSIGIGSESRHQRTKTWSFKCIPQTLSNISFSPSHQNGISEISEPFNCQTNYHLIYDNPSKRMSASSKRGCLVVLEGLDRVGKSTLALKLIERLEQSEFRVELLRFPARSTPIGTIIDKYLKNDIGRMDDRAVHLLYSANRWEFNSIIRKKLRLGISLIVDRYVYSGIAYSSAKKGMNFDWCRAADIGLPRPDVVIYLQASPDQLTSRPGYGDERFEKTEFQEKIREYYEMLIGSTPERWLRFDVGNKSSEQVFQEVYIPVKRFIEGCGDKEIYDIEVPTE